MTSDNSSRRPAIAAIAATFLVLAFGLAYRALAAQLGVVMNSPRIPPEALAVFPMQIGDWTGQDVPLDEAIVRRTGTDTHINRRYSRRDGLESVCLYLASGVKTHALVGHRPETCYVRAGWTLTDYRSVELLLSDGAKLPCTIFQFSRDGLDAKQMTVLNYFIVDGQRYGNVSVLQSKTDRRLARVDFVTQVQIVPSAETPTADSAMGMVGAFAVDSALPMARLLEEIEKDRSSR